MPKDPDGLEDLVSLPSEMQAEIIAGSLRDRGIEARVMGGLLTGFRAEIPAVARVMVRRRDLAAAKGMLADIRSESIDIDWDEVDVGQGEPGTVIASTSSPGGTGVSRLAATQAMVLVAAALAVLLVAWAAGLWPWAGYVTAIMAFLLVLAGLALVWGRNPPDPFDRNGWNEPPGSEPPPPFPLPPRSGGQDRGG